MEPTDLTEALILQNTYPEIFRRGEDYAENGAVVSLVRQGDDLLAEVAGSHGTIYNVSVSFQTTTIEASCTCPYTWGGWCKHIVAALLTYLDQSDSIEERPRLEDLLDQLDRDQLQALLLGVVRQQPMLADVIVSEISLFQHRSDTQAVSGERATQTRDTSIDAGAYRRQVRSIVHGLDHMRRSEAYWHVGAVASGVAQLVEDAWEYIRQGDGRAALAVLDAITDEYFKEWTFLDDSEGEASALFYELAPAWTEALLSADLTQEEREVWAHRLDVWTNELDDYGIDGFWDAVQAAQQGWNHPLIQAALRGEYDEQADPDELDDIFDHSLITARLNVLERRDSYEDFLSLASVAQHDERYAAMLAQLGRTSEAVAHARTHLRQSGKVLTVVRALWEQGAQEEALALAEFGITLPEDDHYYWTAKRDLAIWLRDEASSLGLRERALEAAIVAFRYTTDLPNYLRVKDLAGPDWPQHRQVLLDELRRPAQFGRAGHVDIWLHEGLIDEAIAEAERGDDYRLIGRVARAAVESRPDWVISACRRQAEAIINPGRADYYAEAIHWLELAQSACPTERLPEWHAYLDDLIERHKRKYKLRPMLTTLRAAGG